MWLYIWYYRAGLGVGKKPSHSHRHFFPVLLLLGRLDGATTSRSRWFNTGPQSDRCASWHGSHCWVIGCADRLSHCGCHSIQRKSSRRALGLYGNSHLHGYCTTCDRGVYECHSLLQAWIQVWQSLNFEQQTVGTDVGRSDPFVGN